MRPGAGGGIFDPARQNEAARRKSLVNKRGLARTARASVLNFSSG